ncbi:phosphoglycerate kinase [Candidatus Saccharibacteria bacterium]|nr:phosphoglycerate kinase [Candidatus Saccharibacteria bacterium]
MFSKKTIKDIDVNGKTVLVRVDYNVPMSDGEIESDIRIRASLPTIEYLISNGAKKIILISHLGRPKGERKPELSLKPVAEKLSEILDNSVINSSAVKFSSEVFGDVVKNAVAELPERGILLLENLRFFPEEEKNDAEFAKKIVEATGTEVFVQDGFAVIHRAHASTDAVTKILPSVAGFLVEKEVSVLSSAISEPEKPVLVIIGGAKVDDKKPLIEKFLPIADDICVGGKIASDGYEAEDKKILVAFDFVEDETGAKLDIGTKSTKEILEKIHFAKTIVWNGTVGLTEKEPFDLASKTIARAIGHRTDATSIICGGDTTGFVENLQKLEPELKYSLISTGGGASLELLSGLELPGLSVLQDKI